MNNSLNISSSIKGFFTWQIVDSITNEIIALNDLQQNLILNQGLDFVAVRTYAANTIACAVGSSVIPPLTTDTGLTSELARTIAYDSTYLPCLASLSSNIFSIRRTFRFATQTQDQQFGEIGWSYTDIPGNNLFSKAQLLDVNGNPVLLTVYRNQYLRVTYTLQITLTPVTPLANGNFIDGGPGSSDGTSQIQLIGLQGVTSDGTLSDFDAGGQANEPSQTASIFISTNSAALATFGSTVNRSVGANEIGATLSSYSAGSYSSFKTVTFGRSISGSTFRTIGIGPSAGAATSNTYTELFNTNQTKDSSFQLTINILYSWGRL